MAKANIRMVEGTSGWAEARICPKNVWIRSRERTCHIKRGLFEEINRLSQLSLHLRR